MAGCGAVSQPDGSGRDAGRVRDSSVHISVSIKPEPRSNARREWPLAIDAVSPRRISFLRHRHIVSDDARSDIMSTISSRNPFREVMLPRTILDSRLDVSSLQNIRSAAARTLCIDCSFLRGTAAQIS